MIIHEAIRGQQRQRRSGRCGGRGGGNCYRGGRNRGGGVVGLSEASGKEAEAAVGVVAVLSNARPRRINTSRGRDEPAVLSSCAKSR